MPEFISSLKDFNVRRFYFLQIPIDENKGEMENIICFVVWLIHLQGYRLRLVGHSLGAAAAALLAIMLRQRPAEDLGFDPNIISAVGFGTPPCVSKEVAESCASFVSNVVLQVRECIFFEKLVLLTMHTSAGKNAFLFE